MEAEESERAQLKSQISNLSADIDSLEDALEPLLKNNLVDISSKLPLLDQAKLHALVAYAVETILFSELKLSGVDAKNHPVYTELLARTKQYFAKIKDVENGDKKRENLSLDKPAAGRILRHALAGNGKYDKQRAEQKDKEAANARKKFEEVSDQVGTSQRFKSWERKRKRETGDNTSDSEAITPKKSKDPDLSELVDGYKQETQSPRPDSHKRKDRHKNSSVTRKQKSVNPPKSGSTVFQELLTRGSGNLGDSKDKG